MKKVDYAKEIVNQLYEPHFPKDTYNLEIHQVQKNNGLILTGITIRENDNTICPSFYVEGYQSEYTPKEAAREIASQYYKRLDKDKNLILEHYEDGFDDFDKIKDKICFKVVNGNLNKEFLKNVPHFDVVGDIKGIFYLRLTDNMSVKITDKELERWNIDKEIAPQMLYLYAKQNTPKLNPLKLESLEEVIKKMMKAKYPEYEDIFNDLQEEETIVPLYVLTNKSGLNGAAVMFYNDGKVLEDIKKELNFQKGKEYQNLYILPSSIRETMIVPDDGNIEPDYLREMVREANASGVVTQTEFLDNDIYCYNSETGLRVVEIEPPAMEISR